MSKQQLKCNLCDNKADFDWTRVIEVKEKDFKKYRVLLCNNHLAKSFVTLSHCLIEIDMYNILSKIGRIIS